MSTFIQLMKAKQAWKKAYDREVKLRYKLEELEENFELPEGTAKIEEYNGKTYVVTIKDAHFNPKLIITEVVK